MGSVSSKRGKDFKTLSSSGLLVLYPFAPKGAKVKSFKSFEGFKSFHYFGDSCSGPDGPGHVVSLLNRCYSISLDGGEEVQK